MNRIKGSLMELLQEDLAKAYDVFVDMDGVLTDFERRFEQFAGVTPDEYTSQKTIQFGKDKANEQFWNLIDKEIGVRFWAGMPWMPQGEDLYKYIKKYKPTILTSPPTSTFAVVTRPVVALENCTTFVVTFPLSVTPWRSVTIPESLLPSPSK